MRIATLLATCMIAVSCSPPPSGMSPEPAPSSSTPYSLTPSPGLSSADRITIQEIAEATLRVITSEAFERHLAGLGIDSLWLSPTEGTLPPRDVADIYLGRRAGIRLLPTRVGRVSSLLFWRTPVTDLYGSPATSATITLTRWELSRWRSGTAKGRSCAVNTMAHEIAHTVWDSTGKGHQVFTDPNPDSARAKGRALVSYVVGSVAQCTMLENPNAPPGDFSACVAKWGTSKFLSGDCGG